MNRTAIGPNGRDVFAVSICHFPEDNKIELATAMVEAISKEEALGIAYKMAKGLNGQVVFNVQSKVGPYDFKTQSFENYQK